MRGSHILCIFLLSAALSCTRTAESGRDTIALVKDIASDTESRENVLLSSFRGVPSSGSICIIGPGDRCEALSAAFTSCDMFENARGRKWSDDLKDFAGELFSSICDDAFTPYSGYAAEHGEDALRAAAVRLSLAALDSRCSVSVYDLDGNYLKAPAKVIVLSDPWLHQYGRFDVDTLFSLTSCMVPVISPQSLMFDEVFGGEHKSFTLGVLCDSVHVRDGIYDAIYREEAARYGVVGSSCTVASVNGEGLLKQFLGLYSATAAAPLDALLVDDLGADVALMEEELSHIRDFNREESMLYGKLISPSFRIVSSRCVLMEHTYRLLRERDLFTHRIAQPHGEFFHAVSAGGASPESFLLIPASNVQN